MKTLTLLFILFNSAAFAQDTLTTKLDSAGIRRIFPSDTITHKIMYREVVYVPGKTKQQIFDRANEWFARTFDSSKNTIQYADANAGKMIGRGIVQAHYTDGGATQTDTVGMTITVEMKDGKVRCTINQVGFIGKNGQIENYFDSPAFLRDPRVMKKTTSESLVDANKNITDLITNFNTAILYQNSDWEKLQQN